MNFRESLLDELLAIFSILPVAIEHSKKMVVRVVFEGVVDSVAGVDFVRVIL